MDLYVRIIRWHEGKKADCTEIIIPQILLQPSSTRDGFLRDRLYEAFRHKEIPGLILSRVGNFAVDLPDADVLIQVSGKYGSRQEEAQRLGRILRPKADGHNASFYTLVSLQTCEEDFARHRQLFLTEQGYNYRIEVQKDKRQKDGARSASPSNEMVN
ncbi:hypothetical protein QUA00_17655 [Microcoleus sp. T2B6]|uniref:helicase-related protein n=1 Tax=Microcoleus sp. T2B6 TaxID=3055424 RepID=UPI002FD59F04